MNEQHTPDEFDQRLLDRLVDGELDDNARRALLSSLDEQFINGQPDGWRRCALAFVEAQTWGQEMKHLVTTEDAAESLGNGSLIAAGQVSRGTQEVTAHGGPPRSAVWLAVAAGLLVAFGLGAGVRHLLPGNEEPMAPSGIQVAESHPPTTEPPVATETLPSDPLSNELVRETESVNEPPLDYDPAHEVALIFEDPDGGAPRRVVAPLLPAEMVDERLQWHGEGALSSEIVRMFRQAGHDIQTTRRYAPIQLEDGRRMVVPIDDVKITPIKFTML